MKKFCLLAACSLLLLTTGCGKKEKSNNNTTNNDNNTSINDNSNEYHAFQFNWKSSGTTKPYAYGRIENRTDESCNFITLKLKFKHNGIEEEGDCIDSQEFNPGDRINLECLYTGNTSNITDYEIEVTDISCFTIDN